MTFLRTAKDVKVSKGRESQKLTSHSENKMLIQTIEVEKKISRYPPTDELRTIRRYTPHEEISNSFEKVNHKLC